MTLLKEFGVDNSSSFYPDNRKKRNGREIFNFKAANKNVNFPTQFSLGSVSNGFSATESIKVSINGNVYELSVDYNSIEY